MSVGVSVLWSFSLLVCQSVDPIICKNKKFLRKIEPMFRRHVTFDSAFEKTFDGPDKNNSLVITLTLQAQISFCYLHLVQILASDYKCLVVLHLCPLPIWSYWSDGTVRPLYSFLLDSG